MLDISFLGPILIAVLVFAGIAAIILLFKSMWQTAGPNEVLIIYGRKKERYIHNSGGAKLPWFEKTARMPVKVMNITWQDEDLPTKDFVTVEVKYVAKAKFNVDNTDHMKIATQLFLGSKQAEIIELIKETLMQNSREIVAGRTAQELHLDRESFIAAVNKTVKDDMDAMGVTILSLGIQDLTDNQGYFKSLGKPEVERAASVASIATAEAQRDADIATAESKRDADVSSAEAKRLGDDAALKAERETIEQEEQLRLRRVEMERLEETAQENKNKEVESIRAEAAEARAQAEQIVPAEATAQAETIRAQGEKVVQVENAEADRLAREQSAQAELVEAQRRAEATLAEEQATAEGTRVTEQAVADGILANKTAEAQGIELVTAAEAAGEMAMAAALEEKAKALAAQGSIQVNERIALAIVEAMRDTDVAQAEAIGQLGQKIDFTYLGGSNGSGSDGTNPLLSLIEKLPAALKQNVLASESLDTASVPEIMRRVAEMLEQGEAQIETDTE